MYPGISLLESVGHPPLTAPVRDSTWQAAYTPRSAPAEASEPTASRSAPAAAARWRASKLAPRVGCRINTRASCRRQALPVFAIPSGTACPKSPKTSRKLRLLFPARVSRSRPRRGEAEAPHLSNGGLLAPSSVQPVCKSPLIPCSSAPSPRLLLPGNGCSCGVGSALARLAGASRMLLTAEAS
jgi:hypothetical protein